MVINFIKIYWIDILIVCGFVTGCVLLVRKGKVEVAKKLILAFVTRAEERFPAPKSGELKYAFVLELFYGRLPLTLRWMFTPQDVNAMIEEAVELLKKHLQEPPKEAEKEL